mgnify:CR=1 FL=1
MVNKVYEQGANLDNIEGNIIESEDKANKAKKEITKTDEMSRGNNIRIFCFIAIITIVI